VHAARDTGLLKVSIRRRLIYKGILALKESYVVLPYSGMGWLRPASPSVSSALVNAVGIGASLSLACGVLPRLASLVLALVLAYLFQVCASFGSDSRLLAFHVAALGALLPWHLWATLPSAFRRRGEVRSAAAKTGVILPQRAQRDRRCSSLPALFGVALGVRGSMQVPLACCPVARDPVGTQEIFGMLPCCKNPIGIQVPLACFQTPIGDRSGSALCGEGLSACAGHQHQQS
jgi:hypothetical protein